MTPPPRPFRLVYRAFDRIEFDPAKSAAVFEDRGFDLGFISRIFPGYVLEREDTHGYDEARFQVIGELLGEVYEVIYARRQRSCRIITAWTAEPAYRRMWDDR